MPDFTTQFLDSGGKFSLIVKNIDICDLLLVEMCEILWKHQA